MSQSLPSASTAAQQKCFVTYTAPCTASDGPRVTILEARNLLASSGTTGFRTWEAALFLGAYLSSEGNRFVKGRYVFELGTGTGFLSILCAKHLGAQHVLATDGSQEVITDLRSNLQLNQLDGSAKIKTAVLQWGHALINVVADCRAENRAYDIVLGADVVGGYFSSKNLTACTDILQDKAERGSASGANNSSPLTGF